MAIAVPAGRQASGAVFVPGRGPLTARICVVGEAPGRQEVLEKIPFCGPSGKRLTEWISSVGLLPSQLRYENVYPYLPEGGDIQAVARDELARWQEDCLARLDALERVQIIVPTGNVAMATLLGLPLERLWTSDHQKHLAGITTRRGSLYQWRQASGRMVTVIPTIHPAAVLREKPEWEGRCRADWSKIARELQSPGPVPPRRTLLCDPPIAVIEDFVAANLQDAAEIPLALDIETYPHPSEGKILCMSFARSADLALCLSWHKTYLPWIRTLCESARPKLTQNGFYDLYWLRGEGIEVDNWLWDTLAMHHCLDPLEPHSLAFQCSIHTREPWYKGGDEETGEKAWNRGETWDTLLEYCAKDAVVTWECGNQEYHQLVQRGLLDQYFLLYQQLFGPILDCMWTGFPVDDGALVARHQALREEALRARDLVAMVSEDTPWTFKTKVEELCWRVARGETDQQAALDKALKRVKGTYSQYLDRVLGYAVSNPWLMKTLYQRYGLPQQRQRKTKRPTVDEEALLTLRLKYGDTLKYQAAMQVIEQTLTFRRLAKLAEFADPHRVDPDGRHRASYNFLPVTNRLNSKANPRGRGASLQTIARKGRGVYCASPGRLLLEMDLSQAEARDVYVQTGSPKLIEIAQTPPWEFDVHRYFASLLFQVPEAQVSPEQRQVSKSVGHGSHYGLGADKLAAGFLKRPELVDRLPSVAECKAYQAQYFGFADGILDWQRRVRVQMVQTRTLTNAWGRSMTWPWHRFGDDLYQKAYAWTPQSDIGIHLNQAWARLWRWARRERLQSQMLVQLHDGLIWDMELDEVWPLVQESQRVLEAPHNYYGVALSIPVEFKLGLRWGQGVTFGGHVTPDRVQQAVVAALAL